jgi:Cu-Zn family superoxide dismutase
VGDSIPYDAGFNLNGIVSSASGRHLLTVQSNTGRLWRISTRTGAVTEVSLGDARVANGDGLVLNGRMLSVVRNVDQVIAAVRLNDDFTRGRIVEQLGLASFRFPTTAAELGDRLLVVNSQLNRRSAGQPPEAPFTVSLAPKP